MFTCVGCRATSAYYSADCCDYQTEWYFTARRAVETVLPNSAHRAQHKWFTLSQDRECLHYESNYAYHPPVGNFLPFIATW